MLRLAPCLTELSFGLLGMCENHVVFGAYAEKLTVHWLKTILPAHIVVEHSIRAGWDIKLVNRLTGETLCLEIKAAQR